MPRRVDPPRIVPRQPQILHRTSNIDKCEKAQLFEAWNAQFVTFLDGKPVLRVLGILCVPLQDVSVAIRVPQLDANVIKTNGSMTALVPFTASQVRKCSLCYYIFCYSCNDGSNEEYLDNVTRNAWTFYTWSDWESHFRSNAHVSARFQASAQFFSFRQILPYDTTMVYMYDHITYHWHLLYRERLTGPSPEHDYPIDAVITLNNAKKISDLRTQIWFTDLQMRTPFDDLFKAHHLKTAKARSKRRRRRRQH